jgi:hypothetical protein
MWFISYDEGPENSSREHGKEYVGTMKAGMFGACYLRIIHTAHSYS